MTNKIFGCLSALLLTLSTSTTPSLAIPLDRAGSQIANRSGATPHTTPAKSDETDTQVDGDRSKPVVQVAQTTAIWPRISLTKVVGGLSQPTHLTHAGDRSGRLFVTEQQGRIRIVRNGALLTRPFLDIANRVSCCGERGLLSVAFPSNYATKKYFYVNYTNVAGNTVVARYRLTNNPNIADPNSEQIILTVQQPYANHNGGQLAFGRDGYLYIGMGDGGGAGDPQNNAQNPASLLGKMLRIDVESGGTPTAFYSIPPTNPFIQTAGYRPEIWALGLRNPWRFSFDRRTGDLYIADVGQSAYEEVNVQLASSPGGENYGWKIMEGAHCYNSNTCNPTGLVLPVAEYGRSQGCSITGGMVYRGWKYRSMWGTYFYGDYCTGRIWGLKPKPTGWQSALLLDSPHNISSFGEDQVGNLYITDLVNGDIYLIKTGS